MDNAKDNQNSLEMAKFVENQTIRTNPFGENRVGERAYRRTERIAAALILLTNHLPYEEPLRTEVRSKATHLLSCVLAVRDEMRSVNSEKIRLLKSVVRELISLVRLLAVSGFISFQNAGAVSEALDELSSFLVASQRSHLSESATFSREDFLDVPDSRTKPHRDHRMSDMNKDDNQTIKDSGKYEGSTTTKRDSISQGQTGSVVRDTRVHAITEVLRISGALGIRDIASNLPEYSEKMIQRELADMAVAGQVKKTGSKRWSTYTLI